MDLLYKERERFIKETKCGSNLSLKNKNDYYWGIEKAFDDAFNQYARRTKKKYATEKSDLMKPIIERLFDYFNSEQDTFNKCFDDCIEFSKKILQNESFGIAQKFVNMSFKYLYCYADANTTEFEHKFEECHMPLDKYSIKWIRTLNNKNVNQRLSAVNNAWSEIKDESLYKDIQELISTTLNNNYSYGIGYRKGEKAQTCILPANKLYAEFIIWHQEKINELHRIIERNEHDFDRLGIRWI